VGLFDTSSDDPLRSASTSAPGLFVDHSYRRFTGSSVAARLIRFLEPPRKSHFVFPLIIYKRSGIIDLSIIKGKMMKPVDLVQGTLDLLIMRIVSSQPMHGWSIAQRIQQVSNEQLQVQQGSLYPALHRLEQHGWIASEWGESDNNRRAKFYSLTSAGRKKLAQEIVQWDRLSAAISLVIREA
jgi:transcriptional regulator